MDRRGHARETGATQSNFQNPFAAMTQHNTALYAKRRAQLAAQLGDGGVAIIPTAPERARNRDSDFPFRHDSYFYYLTGFSEPNAWLVLDASGRSTLFCQPKDLEREIWDGYRLGPDAALQALGMQAAHSVKELDAQLPKLLENQHTVWYPFATHKGPRNASRWLAQQCACSCAFWRGVPSATTRCVWPAR